jgi:hypothetical protein
MKKGFLIFAAIYLFSALAALAQQSKIDGRLVSGQGEAFPERSLAAAAGSEQRTAGATLRSILRSGRGGLFSAT